MRYTSKTWVRFPPAPLLKYRKEENLASGFLTEQCVDQPSYNGAVWF